MKVIEKIFENIRDTPTLPTVYLALSEVMAEYSVHSPGYFTNSIVRPSFRLPGVTVGQFSTLWFSGQIDSISRAVVVLGFDEVQ